MQYKFKIEIVGVGRAELLAQLCALPDQLGKAVEVEAGYQVLCGVWDGQGLRDGFMLIISVEEMEQAQAVVEEICRFCRPQSARAYPLFDLIPAKLEVP